VSGVHMQSPGRQGMARINRVCQGSTEGARYRTLALASPSAAATARIRAHPRNDTAPIVLELQAPSNQKVENASCAETRPQSRERWNSVEAHLARHSGESIVALERIEARIDFNGQELERAVLTGLVQPGESNVGMPEREFDHRELERRDISRSGEIFEF